MQLSVEKLQLSPSLYFLKTRRCWI